MSLVLDASAAVDALVATERQDAAWRAIEGQDLYAPVIIDLEVLSALARLERAGTLSLSEAEQAAADWRALPVERLGADSVLSATWGLRRAVRISDAFYLAAAAATGFSLLTADARLASSGVRGLTVTLLG